MFLFPMVWSNAVWWTKEALMNYLQDRRNTLRANFSRSHFSSGNADNKRRRYTPTQESGRERLNVVQGFQILVF